MFIDVYKELCSQKGKAVTTVARELGISSRTAADWITKGREPRPSTKKKIADYFGVDVSIFDEDVKQPPAAAPPAPLQIVTEKELQLLALWRTLTDDEKTAVYTVAETFAVRHAMEKRTVS